LGEKTASASESLANNLAANAADGEDTVHGSTIAVSESRRQGLARARFGADQTAEPRHPLPPARLMVNHY
jgi:hypothetical protein